MGSDNGNDDDTDNTDGTFGDELGLTILHSELHAIHYLTYQHVNVDLLDLDKICSLEKL